MAIDDEIEMARLIAEIAEIVGYQADTAGSVEEFLRSLAVGDYQVIVTDLCMPNRDAIELTGALVDRGCTAAIVMVSGYNPAMLEGAGKLARARGLDVRGVLTKPFRMDEMQALLRGILEGGPAPAAS
jgi:CheY-like chemotaxis protein